MSVCLPLSATLQALSVRLRTSVFENTLAGERRVSSLVWFIRLLKTFLEREFDLPARPLSCFGKIPFGGRQQSSRPLLQVSPGFQFRPVPPLSSALRGAARGYCGPPSCRSSHGQSSDPGIAFSCARWRAECPPGERLVGTGHRWGGRGRPGPEAEAQSCWDPAVGEGESGDQPQPVPHPHAQLPLWGKAKERSVLRL